ncbi:MAG: CFI-box-CTERM domain-containing protein [Geitlerinemataceae cyanobacterium]
MSTLKSCAECGKPVSSAASRCPHCGSNPHPSFMSCDCCKGDLKSSEAIAFSGSGRGLRNLSFHSYCFYKYNKVNLKCPVCSSHYSFSDLGLSNIKKEQDYNMNLPVIHVNYSTKCRNCGHPIFFDGCNYCGLPILNNNKIKVKVSYQDSDYPSFYNNVFFNVHAECKSKVKNSYGNCFIATAACGENSLEVQTLRTFRDQYLLSHPLGNLFVQVYQKLSPPLASAIKNKLFLKSLARFFIVNPAFQVAKFFVKAKSNID